MLIRPLRPADHGAVGDLTVAAYATVEPATVDTGYDDELRDVAARSTGVDILVAVDDEDDGGASENGAEGRILGAVTYVPGPDSPAAEFSDPDSAGIRMLAVAVDAQGRGVGEALTLACVERARGAGRRQVVLHSTDNMRAAHRLYLRLGFERDTSLDWEPEPGLWLRGFRLRLDGV
jgi:ribosomal protein S18 acetylase RimI-like enzyme